jgi:hypothetical protein
MHMVIKGAPAGDRTRTDHWSTTTQAWPVYHSGTGAFSSPLGLGFPTPGRTPTPERASAPKSAYLESLLERAASSIRTRGMTRNHFPSLFLYRWSSRPLSSAKRIPENDASLSKPTAASNISFGDAPSGPRSFRTRSISFRAVPLGARSLASSSSSSPSPSSRSLASSRWPLPLLGMSPCAALTMRAMASCSPRRYSAASISRTSL